jgi:hypothetical protein
VITKYDLGATAGEPGGLGYDVKNHILFAMCARPNVCVVLNADDGKVLATLPIGNGTDGGGFNPATMEAFSSQRDGTLTIIKESSPTSFAVEQNVQTKQGCKTCVARHQEQQHRYHLHRTSWPGRQRPRRSRTHRPVGPVGPADRALAADRATWTSCGWGVDFSLNAGVRKVLIARHARGPSGRPRAHFCSPPPVPCANLRMDGELKQYVGSRRTEV